MNVDAIGEAVAAAQLRMPAGVYTYEASLLRKTAMSEGVPDIKRIIANTINEKAFGDPDALAAHIIDALTENGIWIVPEDTALGAQPFDELTPEMRPQDPSGNGKGWWFQTSEHGGDEPDNMPQAITARDEEGRWAVYVPLTRGGKIVIPRPALDDDGAEKPIEAKD